VLLGGLGAIAVGLSGLTAAAVHAVAGTRILVSNPTAAQLNPARCASLLAGQPAGVDCRTAQLQDWVGEVIWYRIAAGVLGLLAVATVHLLARRRRRRAQPSGTRLLLPRTVLDTIGATAFTAAAIATAALGLDAVVTARGTGSGQWLSATPIAAAAAVVFGVRLVRDVRATEPTPPGRAAA